MGIRVDFALNSVHRNGAVQRLERQRDVGRNRHGHAAVHGAGVDFDGVAILVDGEAARQIDAPHAAPVVGMSRESPVSTITSLSAWVFTVMDPFKLWMLTGRDDRASLRPGITMLR